MGRLSLANSSLQTVNFGLLSLFFTWPLQLSKSADLEKIRDCYHVPINSCKFHLRRLFLYLSVRLEATFRVCQFQQTAKLFQNKSNMTMLKELQMTWTYVMRNKLLLKMLVPISAGLLGWKLDNMEVERLTLFRDKSALFGRELGVGEKPSWP